MKKIIAITLISLAFVTCRKEDNELYDGPNLNDLYGPFFIVTPLTLSQSTIDFSNDGDLFFNAELSKNTDWVITITGSQSGATRTIEGFDRVLSSQNAVWEGGADEFPAFGLEKAYVEIAFPNEVGSTTLKDSVIISGGKIDKGYLITSFESSADKNWAIDFNQATVTQNNFCSDGESAKGDCYYSWNGTVGWDWGIGGINVSSSSTFGLPTNATNLFFNMPVQFLENVGAEGSAQASALVVEFQEDENGNGVFEPGSEDAYGFTYWSDPAIVGSGWHLITKNYNDLQFDANGNKIEVSGNGLPEPSKLVNIKIVYIANPGGGNAKALIDHLIFTTKEPYKP